MTSFFRVTLTLNFIHLFYKKKKKIMINIICKRTKRDKLYSFFPRESDGNLFNFNPRKNDNYRKNYNNFHKLLSSVSVSAIKFSISARQDQTAIFRYLAPTILSLFSHILNFMLSIFKFIIIIFSH